MRIDEIKSPDYMAGHCHVMAIALKKLHPDWTIRARIGWDEDAADDEDFRVDHVYAVAPDGAAYDCNGRFDNEELLLGPDETGGVDVQTVDFDMDQINDSVARGELRAFTPKDVARAMSAAKTLAEEQQFNFDKYRDSILKLIDQIKAGKQDIYSSTLYNLIVNSPEVGAAVRIGLPPQYSKVWKEYFNNAAFNSDGVWSQRDFNAKLPRKSGQDRTYNYYLTVTKTPNNIGKFFKYLTYLDIALKALSDHKQSPISYKTHAILDSFVDHNDSLKVYYYDPALRGDVENVVQDWVKNYNVETGSRTHTHGVDIKTPGAGSFGMILEKHVMKSLEDIIKKHGPQYASHQYYDWLKKNLPALIDQVKVKY